MKILNFDPIIIAQIFVSVFFSIVFFQSGIDKIIDRKGNLEFFKDHFKNTPLDKIFSPALSILAFLEIITAGICLFGFIYSLIYADTVFIFYGIFFTVIWRLQIFIYFFTVSKMEFKNISATLSDNFVGIPTSLENLKISLGLVNLL